MGDPRWTNSIDISTLKVSDQFGIWPGKNAESFEQICAADYTWSNAMLGQIEKDYATQTGQIADGKISDAKERAFIMSTSPKWIAKMALPAYLASAMASLQKRKRNVTLQTS